MARRPSLPPNFTETMDRLLRTEISLEEAAKLLGYSPTWMARKKAQTIKESMIQGGKAAEEVSQAMVQGALRELAGRGDEIYEIAMDLGDLQTALASMTSTHDVVRTIARIAGIGERPAETAQSITQIGKVDIHTVIGIPGLKLHAPQPIDVKAETVTEN